MFWFILFISYYHLIYSGSMESKRWFYGACQLLHVFSLCSGAQEVPAVYVLLSKQLTALNARLICICFKVRVEQLALATREEGEGVMGRAMGGGEEGRRTLFWLFDGELLSPVQDRLSTVVLLASVVFSET